MHGKGTLPFSSPIPNLLKRLLVCTIFSDKKKNEWNQHFYGEFLESYISVKDGYKIFESDFTQVTEFKVFDQSWNGNHLVKFDEANII